MTERPKYDSRISVGNIITIAVLLIGGMSTFMLVQFQGNANTALINELKIKIEENEDEINALKLNDVRLFEKLDSIYASVQKIEAYIDRNASN